MSSFHVHFQLIGAARDKIGDAVQPIPWPRDIPQPVPVVGDFVELPGFAPLTLQVIARNWRFEIGGAHVDVYLDTVAHDAPRHLKLVK